MEVSQFALARMLLCSFLGGVVLGLLYEILALPRILLCGEFSPVVRTLYRNISQYPRFYTRRNIETSQRCTPDTKRRALLPLLLRIPSDLIFCLLAALLLLIILYATNDGEFRLSAAALMLLGLLICHLSFAKWLSLGVQIVFTVLFSIVRALALTWISPFWMIGRIVWRRTEKLRAAIRRKASTIIGQIHRKVAAARAARLLKKQRQLGSEPLPKAPHQLPPNGKTVFRSGRSRVNQLSNIHQ